MYAYTAMYATHEHTRANKFVAAAREDSRLTFDEQRSLQPQQIRDLSVGCGHLQLYVASSCIQTCAVKFKTTGVDMNEADLLREL